MTGGGGGPIIIRALLDSGRCNANETETLENILENQSSVVLSEEDAINVADIAQEICKRP